MSTTSNNNTTTKEYLHSFEKLDSDVSGTTNYNAWSFRMQRHLEEKELWDIVTEDLEPKLKTISGESTEESKSREEEHAAKHAGWKKKSNEAFSIITNAVKDSQISHIQTSKSAYYAWKTLANIHQGIGTNGRMVLLSKLTTLRFDGKNVQSHVDKLHTLQQQLRNLNKEISDEEMVDYLLISLPKSFTSFKRGINTLPEESRTFEFVSGRLIADVNMESSYEVGKNGSDEIAFEASGKGKKQFGNGKR